MLHFIFEEYTPRRLHILNTGATFFPSFDEFIIFVHVTLSLNVVKSENINY